MRTSIITSLALAATISTKLYAGSPPTVAIGNNFEEIKVTYTEYDAKKANKKNLSANIKPDITSKGINIPKATGASNKQTLKASDAKMVSNGKCIFDINYHSINTGKVKTGKYKNTMKHNGKIVKTHFNQQLQPGQSKGYKFPVPLNEGNNTLLLQLDSDNKISETNEGNNSTSKTFKVIGSCKSLTAG